MQQTLILQFEVGNLIGARGGRCLRSYRGLISKDFLSLLLLVRSLHVLESVIVLVADCLAANGICMEDSRVSCIVYIQNYSLHPIP